MNPLELNEGWDRGEVLEAINLEIDLEPYTPRFEHSPFFLELYISYEQGLPYSYEEDGALFLLSARQTDPGREYRVFKPLRTKAGLDDLELYRRFGGFLEALVGRRDTVGITVYGVPDRKNVIKHVKAVKWKEFEEHVYDVPTVEMTGEAYKNLREKIRRFQGQEQELETNELSSDRMGDVYEVFKKWKRSKSPRTVAFYDLEERIDKLEALVDEEDVIGTLYYIKGRPVGVHAAYILETEMGAAGHFLGLCGLKLPGLYETTQMRFWQSLMDKGIGLVNDGPTWSEGIATFKKKFVPKRSIRVYQGYFKKD
jgi:hypothetical protein